MKDDRAFGCVFVGMIALGVAAIAVIAFVTAALGVK